MFNITKTITQENILFNETIEGNEIVISCIAGIIDGILAEINFISVKINNNIINCEVNWNGSSFYIKSCEEYIDVIKSAFNFLSENLVLNYNITTPSILDDPNITDTI